MAKFGLACEGITDQIVIENILCGFYDNIENLEQEIQPFQPAYDETTRKQKEAGGWEILMSYLSEKRFRDDVVNSEFIIIQVDTDICEHINFNVKKDTSCMETFIQAIKQKLIDFIDKKQLFYEANKDKIIFAISVHSLECWLLPIYKTIKTDKIVGCFETLKAESQKINVTKKKESYVIYDKLSRPLSNNRNLLNIAAKNVSLNKFINSLPDKSLL
ncbi:hypothetical protein N5S71_06190 [Aliarcobacter cryaerophilus]|uniref:hypothetical protein n=1 Tax=Aliarcobacter cryaerophilus TaxID=28198 RepID=UPI0021B6B77D|nr:hypothetical protein [Aliarcobacter cryaerophilus]MCT7462102.1 hypothetical protein [Aliarcobacter cryaerophilus]